MQTETKIYWTHGDVVAESGLVKVYEFDDELFLEHGPGHNLLALESEYDVYLDQFKISSPKGKVLEIGNGLNIASRLLLSFPDVTHLTTVEKDKHVLNVSEMIIPILSGRENKWPRYDCKKHTKINEEGLKFLLTTDKEFDYIFIDWYSAIDEDTIPVIHDMVNAAKRIVPKDKIVCWVDPHTDIENYNKFISIFN